MKLSFDVKAFRTAFGLCAGVAPRQSPKPILQGVLLRSGPDGTTLAACDLELAITCPVPGVHCGDPGSVVLPRDRFGAILATARDEQLYLEADHSTLTVRGLTGKFTLPIEDPDLFPIVPVLAARTPCLETEAKDLRLAIARTVFATDPESTRYALGGTLWEWSERGGLMVVGFDGRRLAQQQVGAMAAGDVRVPASPVVPAKALKLIHRVLGNLEDTELVRIGFPDGGVLVAAGGACVFARLVEGRFPRYQDLFPEAFATRVDLTVGALGGAVAQAQIATSDDSRGVDFAFAPGQLVLSGQAPDVGSSRVELAVPWPADAPPLTIAFDPRYLADPLKALDPDAILAAEFGDKKAAAIFRSDDGYTFVMMPMTR